MLGGHEESHLAVSPVSHSEELDSHGSSGGSGSDSDSSESELLLLLGRAVPPSELSSLGRLHVVWCQALVEGSDEGSLSADDLVWCSLDSEWSERDVLSDLGSLSGLVGEGVGLQSVVPDGLGSSVISEDSSPGLGSAGELGLEDVAVWCFSLVGQVDVLSVVLNIGHSEELTGSLPGRFLDTDGSL